MLVVTPVTPYVISCTVNSDFKKKQQHYPNERDLVLSVAQMMVIMYYFVM